MSSAASRNQVAERAARVRSWALFMFFVALFIRLLVEIVYGGQPSDSTLGSALDATFAAAMSAAIGVFAVAQLVRLVCVGIDRVRSRNVRPLPAFGRWSRTVCEISTTTVLAVLLLAVVLPMTWIEWTSTERGPGEEGSLISALQEGAAALVAGSLLLALSSAVLWMVAEGVAGFREPRSAMISPGSRSQDRRHHHT